MIWKHSYCTVQCHWQIFPSVTDKILSTKCHRIFIPIPPAKTDTNGCSHLNSNIVIICSGFYPPKSGIKIGCKFPSTFGLLPLPPSTPFPFPFSLIPFPMLYPLFPPRSHLPFLFLPTHFTPSENRPVEDS